MSEIHISRIEGGPYLCEDGQPGDTATTYYAWATCPRCEALDAPTTEELNEAVEELNAKILDYNRTSPVQIPPASPWVDFPGDAS